MMQGRVWPTTGTFTLAMMLAAAGVAQAASRASSPGCGPACVQRATLLLADSSTGDSSTDDSGTGGSDASSGQTDTMPPKGQGAGEPGSPDGGGSEDGGGSDDGGSSQ